MLQRWKTSRVSTKAEQYGFTGVWLRDVLLQDPDFGDPATGQIYDMMIYLTYLASKTEKIAFGTSATVLSLRHSLRVAKRNCYIRSTISRKNYAWRFIR